jgi:Flp pilus assembly protein TadB
MIRNVADRGLEPFHRASSQKIHRGGWVPTGPDTAYREGMGKLILIVLAALVLFMIVSAVISALHFLFWIAVVAVLIVGALRLTSGVRRRSRE